MRPFQGGLHKTEAPPQISRKSPSCHGSPQSVLNGGQRDLTIVRQRSDFMTLLQSNAHPPVRFRTVASPMPATPIAGMPAKPPISSGLITQLLKIR